MDHERTFRFRHAVDVRFRDVDIGGHAHHSLPLIYIEEARAAYWREVVGRTGTDLRAIDYILAEARLRYHARVLWPDRLEVGVRVSRLGRKHFEMEYEVRSGDGELLVSATTTQVMYDYDHERSKRLPAGIVEAIEAYEGTVS